MGWRGWRGDGRAVRHAGSRQAQRTRDTPRLTRGCAVGRVGATMLRLSRCERVYTACRFAPHLCRLFAASPLTARASLARRRGGRRTHAVACPRSPIESPILLLCAAVGVAFFTFSIF